jgi:hypothetical protein
VHLLTGRVALVSQLRPDRSPSTSSRTTKPCWIINPSILSVPPGAQSGSDEPGQLTFLPAGSAAQSYTTASTVTPTRHYADLRWAVDYASHALPYAECSCSTEPNPHSARGQFIPRLFATNVGLTLQHANLHNFPAREDVPDWSLQTFLEEAEPYPLTEGHSRENPFKRRVKEVLEDDSDGESPGAQPSAGPTARPSVQPSSAPRAGQQGQRFVADS